MKGGKCAKIFLLVGETKVSLEDWNLQPMQAEAVNLPMPKHALQSRALQKGQLWQAVVGQWAQQAKCRNRLRQYKVSVKPAEADENVEERRPIMIIAAITS